MNMLKAIAAGVGAAVVTLVAAREASALPTKLDRVWGGSGGTVVFIHGHGNCSNPSGQRFDARCGNDPRGYWLNSTEDGGDGHDFMDEATARKNADGTWSYSEALSLRWDGNSQSMWAGANDVAACLKDLYNGANSSGCNPGLLKRTSFRIVAHSEGGAVVDRILSTGWWTELNTGIVGSPVTSAGALAGAKSASALYGVDGASNFCTSLVSWLAGWALKDAGTASLTRGTILGEANNGKAGKSPRWINKITTSGGSYSCNNDGKPFWSVNEHTNDTAMGALCGCIGYSSDDDSDGVLWNYDTDPTSNPGGSNGGKYRAQFTGKYWHWISSWSNHSHNRNDAIISKTGYQTANGCYTDSPGTCIGQYVY
jgi:hypothetical protein